MSSFEELENLTPEEKEVALKLLLELSKGNDNVYQEFKYEEYEEIPVDIITFIKDPIYLGNSWHLPDGTCKLFPYWERRLTEIFPDNISTNYNTLILSGARGLGKAQPLHSLVFTEHGYRCMGELTVGDKVYGNDGQLHKITGIFPQGIKPTMRITFSDKTSTLCAEDHLWTVYDNADYGKSKVITAKEIYSNGLKINGTANLRYSIPITAPLEFSHNETFISPYMMGVILGSGEFSEHDVNFISYDDEIIDRIESELLENNYCLRIKHDNQSHHLCYVCDKVDDTDVCTSNIYAKYGKQLGLSGKFSFDKFIPKEYLYNDVESRIALLQGLIDSTNDTHQSYQGYYSTTSKQFANDIVFLVQSLGGTAELINSCKDNYSINIKLPQDIYTRITQNLNSSKFENSAPSRMIEKIEYVEPEECQCIIIDSKDHLYLTNDLIVTHNSEIAITCILYMMYRLMCLRDPYQSLNLKPTEQVAFAFMNIKLALAEEIGYSKFQNTVQNSPWFMSKGTLTGRTNKVWNPPSFITLIVGSQASDVIGQGIYSCLDGDTTIATLQGDFRISELVDKNFQVLSVGKDKAVVSSHTCTVQPTKSSLEEYNIELTDGTMIKCTPEHRFMLTNGEYKEAQNLTLEDELLDFTPFGYVYLTKNIVNNKIYIGQHRASKFNPSYVGSGHMLQRAIQKYGKNNFSVTLLEYCPDKAILDEKERYYINKFNATNNSIGYNIAHGGQGGNLGPVVNTKISEKLRGRKLSSESIQKMKTTMRNNPQVWDTDRRHKHSMRLKGINKGRVKTSAEILKLKSSLHEYYKSHGAQNKGKVCITDGVISQYINKDAILPEGFHYGLTTKGNSEGKYTASWTPERRLSMSNRMRTEANPTKGKHLREGGNNTNATIEYEIFGKVYGCRKELVEDLRAQGYNISENAIRNIVHQTYGIRTINKFKHIIDNLKWRSKHEN